MGSPIAETSACAAHEPQLQVIRRSIPVRYPIDDPTRKEPGGVVVLEIEVGEHGEAMKVTTVCSTTGPRSVRAARQAIRAWQFGAPAHATGQLELRFTAEEL
jgi:TonB family protein